MYAHILQAFDTLKGHWKIKRDIPNQGKMIGSAHFREITSHVLHYEEAGVFTTINDDNYNVTREYFYCLQDNKNLSIAVFFAEKNQPGKLLHVLQFSESKSGLPLRANAQHSCIHDVYSATYNFFTHDRFCLNYIVKGPAKNYVINTVYDRVK